MSKTAQSVPGPSHVAGNTTHWVIAELITTTSKITTEVIEDEDEVDAEENKMVRK